MNTADIIEQINAEIERLERIRALLADDVVQRRRGRPRGSTTKRKLSPGARKKIAAAQKARWAKTSKS